MLAFLLLLPFAQALFFGSGAGCGCASPQACPPAPACAPPAAPICPVASGCSPSYPSAPPPIAPPPVYLPLPQQPPPVYAAPEPQPNAYPVGKAKVYAQGLKVKNAKSNTDDLYLLETEGFRRVRRDTEAAFDPKCNSEALKDIILKNIDDSTATAKRRIQETAAEELGGRIDVICSSGTFSYIVNTELYCETEKNGITCFAFRQSS